MSEIKSTFICTYCPRPDGEYEDYRDQLGHMTEQEYICPKCDMCRSCGRSETYSVEEVGDLFLTGGSD